MNKLLIIVSNGHTHIYNAQNKDFHNDLVPIIKRHCGKVVNLDDVRPLGQIINQDDSYWFVMRASDAITVHM